MGIKIFFQTVRGIFFVPRMWASRARIPEIWLYVMQIQRDISDFLQPQTGKRWGLIQTRPRNEKWVCQQLCDKGVLCYLPLITKVEIHNRSKRETLLPMFPGYLFACPSLEEETTIRRNRCVCALQKVSEGEERSLLQDLRIVRTCELESANHKLVVNPGLHPGDAVSIKSGPFKGMEAIVVRRINEINVIVNLYFMGQNLDLRCEAGDLVI